MAAPTTTHSVTVRKLSSTITSLWTKIKSTFQTLGNLVTAWGITPSDSKYPSEKLVKTSLDGKANDSDAVHKTGTETVSGAKTFNNTSSVFSGKCANDINGNPLSSAYGVFRTELGSPSLEEQGLIEETFANQLECLSKEKIVYETSPKGTETWTTLAVSDNTHNLLWGGNVTGSLSISKNVDFRITITAPFYCNLNFLYFYGSGNGARFHIKLEKKLNSSGVWSVVSDTAEASIGWPGHNTIRHSSIPFNAAATATSQYGQVRLTLYIVSTGNVESYPTYHIDKFRYYGGYPYKADPWIVKNGSSGVTNFPKGVTSDVAIPISSGGTGKTTAKAAQKALLSNMNSVNTDAPSDANLVFKYASPTDTDGAIFTRPLSKIWTWIKGKLSSDSNVNISGNAATATTAAGYTSGGAIDTALAGKQDDLGISVSGDPQKFLNQQGDFVNPPVGTVSGVKGAAESSYRTGNVELSAANVGAAPVDDGLSTHDTTKFYRGDGTWAAPMSPKGDAGTPIYIDSNGVPQTCGVLLQCQFHYWIGTYNNTGSGAKYNLNSRLAAAEGTSLALVYNNSSTYAQYNAPQSGWLQVETCYHPGTSSYATQIAKAYTGDMYYRAKDNSTWSSWKKLT